MSLKNDNWWIKDVFVGWTKAEWIFLFPYDSIFFSDRGLDMANDAGGCYFKALLFLNC